MCLVKSVFYRPSLIYLEDNAHRFCGRTLVATYAEGVYACAKHVYKEINLVGASNSFRLRHASLNHTWGYLMVHPVSSSNRKSRTFHSRRITRSSSKATAALRDETSHPGFQLILSYTAQCYLIWMLRTVELSAISYEKYVNEVTGRDYYLPLVYF